MTVTREGDMEIVVMPFSEGLLELQVLKGDSHFRFLQVLFVLSIGITATINSSNVALAGNQCGKVWRGFWFFLTETLHFCNYKEYAKYYVKISFMKSQRKAWKN